MWPIEFILCCLFVHVFIADHLRSGSISGGSFLGEKTHCSSWQSLIAWLPVVFHLRVEACEISSVHIGKSTCIICRSWLGDHIGEISRVGFPYLFGTNSQQTSLSSASYSFPAPCSGSDSELWVYGYTVDIWIESRYPCSFILCFWSVVGLCSRSLFAGRRTKVFDDWWELNLSVGIRVFIVQ